MTEKKEDIIEIEKKEDIIEIKTNLNIHQKLLIEDYLDKSFIMSILCEETKNYYYNIRNMLQLPTIILPSILCVFNAANGSIPLEKHYILITINIVLNAIIALFVGLQSIFQINDKYNQFQIITNKFTKLEHYIETTTTNTPESLDSLFVVDIIKAYDSLIDDIDYTFPGFLKNKVKEKYKGSRTMPNILNGDKKPRLLVDNHRN